MRFNYRVRGTDGQSADDETKRVPVTRLRREGTIVGTPKLGVARTRCDVCGTSDVISGRPGTTIREFTCRTCKTTLKANGGVGFTFWCQN